MLRLVSTIIPVLCLCLSTGCTLRAQTRAAGATRSVLNADAETIEVVLARKMDAACDLASVPVQPDAARDACVAARIAAVDTPAFHRWRAAHDAAVLAWRSWVEAVSLWAADLTPFEAVLGALRGVARVWCDLRSVVEDHGVGLDALPSVLQQAVAEVCE